MGLLLDYRTSVVEALVEALPTFKTIEAHAGVFGPDSLKRITTLCPAAMVALLQAKTVGRNNIGQMIGPVLSTVYVVAKDPKHGEAWGPAIDLAESVSDAIELNTFGLSYAAAARVKDVDVLYNSTIDSMGLCLAAVSFTQEVSWGRDRNLEDEQELYPDWTAPEVVEAGWPKHLVGRGKVEPVSPPMYIIRLIGPILPPPPPPWPEPQMPPGYDVTDEDV